MGDLQHTLVAWLLTYGLHSTALIGLIWFGVRCLPKESNLAQERLWKCALIGPILTASLQVGLAYEPLGGQLFLPETEATASASELPVGTLALESEPDHGISRADLRQIAIEPEKGKVRAKLTPLPVLEGRKSSKRKAVGKASSREKHDSFTTAKPTDATTANMPDSADSLHLAALSTPTSPEATLLEVVSESTTPPVLGALTSPTTSTPSWPFWRHLLLGVWAIGGLFGLLCLAIAWRRIVDYVTGRHELHEGPLFEQLQSISHKAGLRRAPRLLVSKKLGSPATLGVVRPQICVPERAVSQLSADQQEAMLGHELGHVVRRDPQWFFLYRLIERVLFFQPLNSIARREIQELAEYQCDDWAVKHTENGLGLARCLTEVASWMVAERPTVALLPMAGRGSQLGHRVRRLLDEESRQASACRNIWGLPLALCVFATGAMALPAVNPRRPVKAAPSEPIAIDLGPPSVMSPSRDEIETATPRVCPPAPVPAAAYPRLGALLEQLGDRLDQLEKQIAELQDTAGSQVETHDDLLRLRLRLLKLREQQLRMTALLHSAPLSKNTSTLEPKTTFNGQE